MAKKKDVIYGGAAGGGGGANSGLGQAWEWMKTHTLRGGPVAPDPTNVAAHPDVKFTYKKPSPSHGVVMDEISGRNAAGDPIRYIDTVTPKGSTKRSKPATTSVVPTKRPAPVAAAKQVATSRPKARGIQSWRMGGSDDYNPRYDPGTKPSVPKKAKSRANRGVHDFSGLKGFFK